MRRRMFLAAAGGLLSSLGATAVQAADYPSRMVRIVVPYPAGSGPDMLGRVVAQQLQQQLKQSVVVENRAGALGVVGTTEVARAAADGYTLLLTTNTTQAANVALVKDLRYDPVKDFVPIARITMGPMMLMARADTPYGTVDAVKRAAREGRKFSIGYGSAASQVSAAKFSQGAGLDVINVAYKGIPVAVNDLLGGHIDFTVADLPVAVAMLQSGRVRVLGVTSAQRLPEHPDIPALVEFFPGFQVTGWQGIVTPAGTPAPVLAVLDKAFREAFEQPAFVDRLKAMHQVVAPLYGPQFGAFIDEEIERWKVDARSAGLEPQ